MLIVSEQWDILFLAEKNYVQKEILIFSLITGLINNLKSTFNFILVFQIFYHHLSNTGKIFIRKFDSLIKSELIIFLCKKEY